jgi:SAM-dependent methyltransferase
MAGMNDSHLQFLASPAWAAMLETDLLPWLTGVADLGDDVLEVGPGPGLTTDVLRRLTSRLTAVEVDGALAAALADRMSGTGVEVRHGDAADTGLADGRFSAVTCFAMLHHVPSPGRQDQVFAEVHRVLRPSGVFIATDALDNQAVRQGHLDDIFVPIDPETLPARLEAAGFTDVSVECGAYDLRFHARKRRASPVV